MGSLWGTLATSLLLHFLSLRGYFGTFDDAVFGLILVVVMLFAPNGILSLELRRALAAVVRRGPAARAEPVEDARAEGGR
jgi:branched-chain amino acid transport system permease protein